jgi:GNAT superfamily N-acetyltransferase
VGPARLGDERRLSRVAALSSGRAPEVVAVFSDAFADYPVMRYVLGPAPSYEPRLRRLVELFVSGRAYRGEPMLGAWDAGGALVGAATMTLPRSPDPPATFLALRESIWGDLGADARARYDAFVAATQGSAIAAPHHHLNMIGVRRAHQGQGLARALLDAVHDLAGRDRQSTGVSLTTELPANVTLYERFGYRVQGHARVAEGLETWTLFRATPLPAC